MNILHLTHTDINSDSRILKELVCISNDSRFNVNGIGVLMNEGSITSEIKERVNINSIQLLSRKLTFLPTVIVHFLSVIELTIKMFSRALKSKPKVIHCHDTLVLPLGVILKFLTGAKLIYDAHELESNRNGLSNILGKMTIFVEKFLWKSVDGLIVVSPSIKKWYSENIGNKYTEVILNSPVLEKNIDTIDKEYLRDKFSISKDSKIFLYIGILGKGRGIELISEVFKNNDLTSSLIFLGYGDLSHDLKLLAKKYSNIYVHDAVAHDKVVSVARSADVGLCLIEKISLSDYYCLPNKLFEYCFSEIPVLASNFPDISYLVNKYNLGKCSELDFENVTKTIKEFERMNQLPKINSNDLYELSWDTQEKKLIKLYNKIIEEK